MHFRISAKVAPDERPAVYPRNPDTFWSFQHVLRFVSKKSAFPPLGLLTVAAMLPRAWSLRLADLNVRPLADADLRWADYVLLSGMIVHKPSAHEIAARCVAHGKPVIAGGPLFTTGHRQFPEIRHFVLGEAENVIEDLVRDMERGAVQPVYRSPAWPDVRQVPVPRWDLVRLRDYVAMPVQFSRGCPFDCEFCDIVVMNGRVPRTKQPEQVVRELEALRRRGWSDMVFIVDDNFIGNRKRAKALLREMIAWHARTAPKMGFLTEASMNLADDPELCELMAQAGFKKVFMGIETPSPDGLQECNKRQNRGRDLAQAVKTVQRAGMEVMGGFIVGFDSDPRDIFRRQFEFIQQSGVVTAMVGLAQRAAGNRALPPPGARGPHPRGKLRQQHRRGDQLRDPARPRLSAGGLPGADARAVRAGELLSTHSHLSRGL